MNSFSAVSHLDRLVTEAPAVYASPTTTWTLPYQVPTDQTSGGYLAIARTDTNIWLNPLDPITGLSTPLPGITVTRPSTTTIAVSGTGDLSAVDMNIGLIYPATYELSTIYFRNQKGAAETRGRLRVGYINLSVGPMTDMTIVVVPQGRDPYYYVYSNPTASEEIQPYRVPIQARNEDTTITVQNNTPGGTRLVAWDWEGELVIRSRAQ